MKMVYEQYSGKSFDEPIPQSEKGRVKAIHYIQSFDPKDNISQELAHRIGKAFALKVLGAESQVVIAAFSAKLIMRVRRQKAYTYAFHFKRIRS